MNELKFTGFEKKNHEIILGEIVKGLTISQREEILDRYGTCLDCATRFFEENKVMPKIQCRNCDYKNYRLFW